LTTAVCILYYSGDNSVDDVKLTALLTGGVASEAPAPRRSKRVRDLLMEGMFE